MSHFIASCLILALMVGLKKFQWLEEVGGPLTPSTVTVGFILLTAYMAGKASQTFRLPKITGYMFVGILVGPFVFNLISFSMTQQLQLINGLALSLIALTAGGELRIRELGGIWKSLAMITVLHMAVLWFVFVAFIYAARPMIPFLAQEPVSVVLVVGMILGCIAAASSPAVAMAIINECRARGEVTENVLSVTVFKDILVIVFFSVVVTLGQGMTNPQNSVDLFFLGSVMFEILGSIGIGILLGVLMALYLRWINTENTLFVLGVCFLSAEIGMAMHLEPAIIALSAGFFIENVYPERGERLLFAIEQGSLPVYTLFFCLSGAVLNLEALRQMWFLAMIVVLIRMGLLFVTTYFGAMLGGGSANVRNWGWLGFVAQAGVSLGLAGMLSDRFLDWGHSLQTLIISVIAINQIVGPVGFRIALIRCGEKNGT